METVLTFARSELRKYYKKTTGADACEIELRIDPSLAEKGDDVKSDDRFRISVLAGKGKIAGINGRSVLLGVYRFFRELGWVFVRPGADGEKGVRKSAEECGVNLAFRPHYRFRTVTIEGANSVEDVIGLIDWSMKNGFNSYFLQFRDSHTFFERWYNHERNEYAAKGNLSFNDSAAFVERIVGEIKKRGMLYHAVGHGWTCECLSFPSKGWNHVKDEEITPDKRKYLAKVGGNRKFYLDTPLYSQLCYSDPKVRELIAEEVVSYIEKHGEIDYLHVWLGDNYNNFCECESCRQKIPTDWYFMILNEIDRRLSALKKDTKIVFLIYFELLWPSQTVALKNPDRFVLMFAPITRTYAHGFLKEGEEVDKELPVPQFELNKIVFPSSTKENLAFLFAHQKTFHGDCFDFDYHLMWEPYKDLGGLRIASVVYGDVRSLESLGMNGLASCQVQKVFMPHGFGMFVMGRTLEDPSLSLEGLREEYFGALYSSHEKRALEILERIEASECCAYLRNEIGQRSDEAAKDFDTLSEYLFASLSDLQEREERESDALVKKSLAYLRFYCELLRRYLKTLAIKARGGDREALSAALKEMHDYLFLNEEKAAPVMDTYEFDLIAEQIVYGEWNIIKCEGI